MILFYAHSIADVAQANVRHEIFLKIIMLVLRPVSQK